MIDCREAVSRMWAYLESGLERQPAEELDLHLDTCVRCCGELEFSRHLRARVAVPDVLPLPPHLRRRIESLVAGSDEAAGG